MKDLKWHIRNGNLVKMPSIVRLTNSYLEKAEKNLTTMSILSELEKSKDVRKLLNIPDDYSSYEWIVTTGYYSMYMASLSLLAKIGFKSSNHEATILALEEFFVKKGLIEKEILEMIKDARLEAELVEIIRTAKDKREIAQYSPTKKTSESIAKDVMKDAYKFVERIKKLIEELGLEPEKNMPGGNGAL